MVCLQCACGVLVCVVVSVVSLSVLCGGGVVVVVVVLLVSCCLVDCRRCVVCCTLTFRADVETSFGYLYKSHGSSCRSSALV